MVGSTQHPVVTDTVEKWDPAETTEKIELMVGRDLQYIRLNGTVVGALAGLVILHEHLTGQQWLAIAAIVAASVGAIATTRSDRVRIEPA